MLEENVVHTTKPSNLPVYILLSLILHGVVIMLAKPVAMPINISSQPAGSVQFGVILTQDTIKAPHNTPASTVRQKNTPIPNSRPDSPRKQQHVQTNEVNTIHTPQGEKAGQTNDTPVPDTNHMVKYLQAEFKTRFQYPLLARKHGWEGQVIIGLDVTRSGLINHVKIKQSSGYAVLDNNAVRTFQEIGDIIPALEHSYPREFQLLIPVIYQLTGG